MAKYMNQLCHKVHILNKAPFFATTTLKNFFCYQLKASVLMTNDINEKAFRIFEENKGR